MSIQYLHVAGGRLGHSPHPKLLVMSLLDMFLVLASALSACKDTLPTDPSSHDVEHPGARPAASHRQWT
jgi:hypothetical protein